MYLKQNTVRSQFQLTKDNDNDNSHPILINTNGNLGTETSPIPGTTHYIFSLNLCHIYCHVLKSICISK